MALTISSAVLLICGLIGMLGSVTWILRRGNNNRVTRLFMICQLAIVLWLISQLLILFSATRTQLWISYFIGNIGISLFSPLWLMFSAEFISASSLINRIMKLLPCISLCSILLILTNPLHHLYYRQLDVDLLEYGPLFYVFQVLYYLCIITGITMMCLRHSRAHNRITKQTILLTLSTAVPMAINTLTVTRIIDIGIELTPLLFAFSSIMILLALSRYGLLNIKSIAINDTIDNISTGVLVFDADRVLSYRNKYAEEVFACGEGITLLEFLARLESATGTSMTENFSSAETEFDGHCYNLRQSFCKDRSGRTVARIIMVNNVTEYYELARTEKRLSIEQERNRIAQEIHDSAGHTFTMISSLARVLQVQVGSSPELSEYLSEIDGLSRSGVTQLRCSINNLRDDEFMTSVTGAVQSVIGALRNIDTDVCVQGTEDQRYAFCIREVYDSCRETITNTMRYSGASRIDIIVKFLPEQLEVYIFDNGRGCRRIDEHNGLQGIRSRIESLGGAVRFNSVEGEGFTTIMKIPVKG